MVLKIRPKSCADNVVGVPPPKYTVANSNAMNGVTAETKIVSVTPWWKIALICVDVVLGVLVAVSIFMLVKRIKARKAAKALTAPAEDQE